LKYNRIYSSFVSFVTGISTPPGFSSKIPGSQNRGKSVNLGRFL
jgi:hypothetical protein